jgi:hypothetical protein
MMENKHRIHLQIPLLKSEDTIAWFWSGINIKADKDCKNYTDYIRFYEEYRKRMWNQSS